MIYYQPRPRPKEREWPHCIIWWAISAYFFAIALYVVMAFAQGGV